MSAAAIATAVRERPILFAGRLVRAILDGRKTQTRRIVSPAPEWREAQGLTSAGWAWSERAHLGATFNAWRDPVAFGLALVPHCPYGRPRDEVCRRSGDRLWVREAWSTRLDRDHLKPSELDPKYDSPFFWADPETAQTGCGGAAGRKRASFHMPRWASRLTLEIAEIRVQRLQDISEEDAKAEGVEACTCDPAGWCPGGSHHHAFAATWDVLNRKRAPWDSNPWVWCLTFRRLA